MPTRNDFYSEHVIFQDIALQQILEELYQTLVISISKNLWNYNMTINDGLNIAKYGTGM